MVDISLETIRAIIVCIIFGYLLSVGIKKDIRRQEGWVHILLGLALISFGMLIDITDNFDSLNRYIIIGDTKYQAFLEKVVGYLFGYLLLAIGFWKWLPIVVELKETKKELRKSHTLLESKVKERTVSLETEIEERKRTEEALKDSQERLETMLHMMPFGIMIVDEFTHEIIDANPKASLMVGSPIEPGTLHNEYFCATDGVERSDDDFEETPDNKEYTLLTTDGESIPIHKTIIPFDLDKRKCFLECFVDISDHKRAECERIQKEKLQGVIEMGGAVCHELNQPMQIVSLTSDLLLEDVKQDDSVYQDICTIKKQTDRMGQITRKLMNVTKYETKDYLNGRIIDIDKAVV